MLEDEEGIVPLKKNQLCPFSILIRTEYEGGKSWPIEYQYDGLAKIGHAKDIAAVTGWHPNQIAEIVGIIEWPEGDKIFPCDSWELFVLKGRLIMN